jgi:hypothetical protein
MASQDVVRQHGTGLDTRAGSTVSLVAGRTRLHRHRFIPWLLLTPWMIGLVGITLGPMLASLYLSFTDYNLLGYNELDRPGQLHPHVHR